MSRPLSAAGPSSGCAEGCKRFSIGALVVVTVSLLAAVMHGMVFKIDPDSGEVEPGGTTLRSGLLHVRIAWFGLSTFVVRMGRFFQARRTPRNALPSGGFSFALLVQRH